MSKLLISATVFTIILAACTKNNFEKDHPQVILPTPAPNPNPTPNPTPTAIDTCKDSIKFSLQIKRLMTSKCATIGCHDGNAQSNFNDYATLSVDTSSVISRIDDIGNPMPPVGSPVLTACDKSKLKAWVKAGAPHN